MPSSDFYQFNPTQLNQQTSAQYEAEPTRSGGVVVDQILPSPFLNKVWSDASIMVFAICQMLLAQGFSTTSTNASTLTAQLASAIALLASPQFSGSPTAPSPPGSDRTTRLATMANFGDFVQITSNSHGIALQFGGIVIQVGTFTTVTGNADVVTFPIAFPNSIFVILANEEASAGWGGGTPSPTLYGTSRNGGSLTTFKLSGVLWNTSTKEWAYSTGIECGWIAIGN